MRATGPIRAAAICYGRVTSVGRRREPLRAARTMGRVSADDQRRAPTPAAELTLKDVTASTVANTRA